MGIRKSFLNLDSESIAEQEAEQLDMDGDASCAYLGKVTGDRWAVYSPENSTTTFYECVNKTPERSVVRSAEIPGDIRYTEMTCQVSYLETIVHAPKDEIASLNNQFNCTCQCLNPVDNVAQTPCSIQCRWIYGKNCVYHGTMVAHRRVKN